MSEHDRDSFPSRKSFDIDRRGFLGLTGSLGMASIAHQLPGGAARTSGRSKFDDYPYSLGVASGDPLPESVVLWTRLAPKPLEPGGGMPLRDFPVHWQIATDEKMSRRVASGTSKARAENAHSVHVDVRGLEPGREYFYRFKSGPAISPIGRTKTAPARDASPHRLTFAFASCHNWNVGYFPAYRDLAAQDLDLVFHLGDYIYNENYGPTNPRRGDVPIPEPARPRPATLEEYRVRHALFKTDPDLQWAHARSPWVVTYDDHDVFNDWAGPYSPQYPQVSVEEFLARRARAFKAYWEHMPIRLSRKPSGASMDLYRRFSFGDLIEFNVLDTRQFRDNQVERPGIRYSDPRRFDADRVVLGTEQRGWLFGGLDHSAARWNVLAQQIEMAAFDYTLDSRVSVMHDAWDGYVAARKRILRFLGERRPSNPVVISGDRHANVISDLKVDFTKPESATVAPEFVGTSISSPCRTADRAERALPENPHVQYFNGDFRGYVRCTVTPAQWQTDLRTVATLSDRDAPARTLATFVVEDGQHEAVRDGTAR